MARARRLLLLLLLLPMSLAWRTKSLFLFHKVPPPGHRTHQVWNIPGNLKGRRKKGWVFGKGEALAGSPETCLALQRTGDTCDDHAECHSRCCVTNSPNPQTFCVSKTIFFKCRPWQKPNGDACSQHADCRSSCCVTNSASPQTFCKPRSIFLQCKPWLKPNGVHCGHHKECRSQCCIMLSEVSRPRCVRRSGLLAQCLPLVRTTFLST